MSRAVDGLFPDFGIVFAPENRNIGSVSTDLFGSQVIECENVLDNAVFILVDSAFFCTCVRHHEYLFLGHSFGSTVGIDAEKTENTVC